MAILKTLAGAAVATVLSMGVASAATCTGGTGGSASTFSLTIAEADDCFSGNDTNSIDSSFVMFGMDGWELAAKNDNGDGDQSITYTDAPVNGAKSGTWGISDISAFDKVVVVLKAGGGFGAFLVDVMSGDWSSSKALSHSSIYYNGTSGTGGGGGGGTTPIPLPAAGWLMLAGLGGIAAMRRRK